MRVSSALRVAPGTVYFVIGDEPTRRAATEALRGHVTTEVLSSFDDLPHSQVGRAGRVIVVGAVDTMGRSTFEGVAALRKSNLGTPVVFCGGNATGELRQLPPFVRLGVDRAVIAPLSDFEQQLVKVVSRELAHALPASLVLSLLPGIDPRVRSEQAWQMRHARWPIAVDELAAWLRVSPSTLRARYAKDGSPSPDHWYQVCRLLHTAWQLDGTVYGLGVIAKRLGFSSEGSMSALVRRLTGRSPRALRDVGAMGAAVLRAQSLRGGRSSRKSAAE